MPLFDMESWFQASGEFYIGTLQLLGQFCIGLFGLPIVDLCFMFWNFVEYSNPFHVLCSKWFWYCKYFTFWNFLETKDKNRLPKLKPKPRMNFSTQAKQCVSQEQ